jgi:hypothetical protein
MMEAERNSETLVNFYQTTRRSNPEDSHLHIRRRENLNSHGEGMFVDNEKIKTFISYVYGIDVCGQF